MRTPNVYQIKHITTGSLAPPSAAQMCSVISVEPWGPTSSVSCIIQLSVYSGDIHIQAGIVSLRTAFSTPNLKFLHNYHTDVPLNPYSSFLIPLVTIRIRIRVGSTSKLGIAPRPLLILRFPQYVALSILYKSLLSDKYILNLNLQFH